MLAAAGIAATNIAVKAAAGLTAANAATATISTTISIAVEAITKAFTNIAAVKTVKAATEAFAYTAAKIADSITVIVLSYLPSALSSLLCPSSPLIRYNNL